jgi:hypothetical protein
LNEAGSNWEGFDLKTFEARHESSAQFEIRPN